MNKVEKNIKFELTDLLINQVIDLVDNNQNTLLLAKLNELHHADIAEILEELNYTEEKKDLISLKKALYLIKNSEIKKGNDLLKKITEKDSNFKFIAEELIAK